jgi:hypothetical protein
LFSYKDKTIDLASDIDKVGSGVKVGTGDVVTEGIGVGVSVGVNINSMVGNKVGDSRVGVGDEILPHAETKDIKTDNANRTKTLELIIVTLTSISCQQDLPTSAYSGS